MENQEQHEAGMLQCTEPRCSKFGHFFKGNSALGSHISFCHTDTKFLSHAAVTNPRQFEDSSSLESSEDSSSLESSEDTSSLDTGGCEGSTRYVYFEYNTSSC